MKMINGRLPTWYVIKRISQDPELYAKAPNTSDHFAVKMFDHWGDPAMHVLRGGKWKAIELEITTRNDWTLYRIGKKKRKSKKGEVKLGEVELQGLADIDGFSGIYSAICDLRGAYSIIAVPVKS